MSGKIASTRITMIVASAVIAVSSHALATSNAKRNDGFAPQSSQYCVPQYDSSGAQRAPYC